MRNIGSFSGSAYLSVSEDIHISTCAAKCILSHGCLNRVKA